jgi:hypothetical protein
MLNNEFTNAMSDRPQENSALGFPIYHSEFIFPRSRWNSGAETAYYRMKRVGESEASAMVKFLLWCILLVLCWPLALLALVLYPVVWLLLLPFRILGIAVEGILELLRAVILFPARLLSAPHRA